jgi:hypothetical protein
MSDLRLEELLEEQRRDLEARDAAEPGSALELELAARLLSRQEEIAVRLTAPGNPLVQAVMDPVMDPDGEHGSSG